MKTDAIILDGKKVAEELYSQLPNMSGKKLVIISIESDDASKVYVRNKLLACNRVDLDGINYNFYLNDYESIDDLAYTIEHTIYDLNRDPNVVGIMIQQPYPKELKEYDLENCIIESKDVDGLTYINMHGTLTNSDTEHYPATPKGIITLLDYYNIPIEGKNVVIIGRSDIVGKPLAAMMTARNATVTLCHSKTKDLKEYTRKADIIVSAVGKAKFIDHTYIQYSDYTPLTGYEWKTNYPVIIDVGINRDENGKLCGDVDYDDVLPYVSAITPVPGGIGPMTIYSLIENSINN